MLQPVSTRTNITLLVFAQFAGTSLWFAGNAIVDALPAAAAAGPALLTAAVQLGFIAGTLLFSLLALSDRVAATRLFFYCSLLAAGANALLLLTAGFPLALLALRFSTGFFLAGIYPVGMKLAAELFPATAGRALGFLVGALVLGTAFPHLVRWQGGFAHWQWVIVATSLLATVGGCLVRFFLPAMPRSRAAPQSPLSAFAFFRKPAFRQAAFSYFGHMWELYAFWALLPLLLTEYNRTQPASLPVSLLSFAVIAAGSIGCAAGGIISLRAGSKKTASAALLTSGTCCFIAPFAFGGQPVWFVGLLLVWGLTVSADSPQFSALVAGAAPPESKGTALTLVTSLGFGLTLVSIPLLQHLFLVYKQTALWVLVPGPVLGLIAMQRRESNG